MAKGHNVLPATAIWVLVQNIKDTVCSGHGNSLVNIINILEIGFCIYRNCTVAMKYDHIL